MKRIKKNLKRYIAFLAVLIIFVSITVTPAYATYSPLKQRISAMIASALLSAEVLLSPILAPAQQMYDYIPDALGIPTTTWDDDYLDRSRVQIWPNYTTIDGVSYTDIWFSNDAAEKFRTDAYDFITQYSLISNSNGTFASGVGHFNGLPLYDINGWIRTQEYTGIDTSNRVLGDGYVRLTKDAVDRYGGSYYDSNGIEIVGPGIMGSENVNAIPQSVIFVKNNSNTVTGYWYKGNHVNIGSNTNNQAYRYFDTNTFDFDWVSGSIPVPSTLPSDTGMMVRVPSDSPGLQTFITNNVDFTIDGGIELDFDLDPTLQVKIDDLLDIIAPIIPILDFGDVQFVVNHETPVPPVQDTLLPDTWWSQVEYKFDQVINAIQNFSLQPVIQAIQTIPSAIQTLGQNITQAISDLGNTILQDIEQGPIKVIDKALDKLKSIFLPILANLRNALGIWHYVVEWVNGISAPFTWIFGIVQGGMSFIMVPIYATIAGWIVIMVYKRFGR